MKHLIVAFFAGSLALSSLSVLAADAATAPAPMDPPKAETKTEKSKAYVKEKAHNASEATKRTAKKAKKKTKDAVKNRKTTEPATVSESKPDVAPAAK